jgi:regulator of replication initiation timing
MTIRITFDVLRYFETEVRKYRRQCDVLKGENSYLAVENQKLKNELKSQQDIINEQTAKRLVAEKSLESLKSAVHNHFVSLKET